MSMLKMYDTLNKIPEKKIKETGKMFKELGKVAGKLKSIPYVGEALAAVMPFLEALAPLFQAFEPILEITNAMFEAFAGALTAELIPALMPLFDALISMIPIFVNLGSIVGQIIATFLVPFIDILVGNLIPLFITIGEVIGEALLATLPILTEIMMALLPPIAALILGFIQSEGFITAIIVVLVILAGVLTYLAAPVLAIIGIIAAVIIGITLLVNFIIDVVVPAMQPLLTIFGVIATIINDVVMPAIGTFIMGIAIMIDAITFGMAGAVNFVNNLMGTLPTEADVTATTSPATEEATYGKLGRYEFMQHGGIAMNPTRAVIGEKVPEVVIPLTELPSLMRAGNNMNNYLLEQNNELLQTLVEYKKRKRR